MKNALALQASPVILGAIVICLILIGALAIPQIFPHHSTVQGSAVVQTVPAPAPALTDPTEARRLTQEGTALINAETAATNTAIAAMDAVANGPAGSDAGITQASGLQYAVCKSDGARIVNLEFDTQAFVKHYPASPDAPGLLYEAGNVMKRCSPREAAKLFYLLVTKYPTADDTAQARVDLQEMGMR